MFKKKTQKKKLITNYKRRRILYRAWPTVVVEML